MSFTAAERTPSIPTNRADKRILLYCNHNLGRTRIQPSFLAFFSTETTRRAAGISTDEGIHIRPPKVHMPMAAKTTKQQCKKIAKGKQLKHFVYVEFETCHESLCIAYNIKESLEKLTMCEMVSRHLHDSCATFWVQRHSSTRLQPRSLLDCFYCCWWTESRIATLNCFHSFHSTQFRRRGSHLVDTFILSWSDAFAAY